MDSSNERREYVRMPKNIRVDLSRFAYPLNAQRIHTVECINISAGGLLLQSPQKFETGEKVQVRIYMPRLNKFHPSYFKVFESTEGQNVLAIGEIARSEEKIPLSKYELGIRFVDVYEDDWRALYQLLQSEMR